MSEKSLRMLVADNDQVSRRILGYFLKAYAEITEAADGDEAMRLYEQAEAEGRPFELIFLDNVMPGKQGPEVLEAIRAHEQKDPAKKAKPVPVIMVTGTASPQQVDRLQRLGISYYLLKPFEEEKLLRELRRLNLITDPEDRWE